jgi:hypothetical protein
MKILLIFGLLMSFSCDQNRQHQEDLTAPRGRDASTGTSAGGIDEIQEEETEDDEYLP